MIIKAVLFDLGNTLVHYFDDDDWPRVKAEGLARCADFITSLGLPVPLSAEIERRILDVRPMSGDNRYVSLEYRLQYVFALAPEVLDGENIEKLQREFMRAVFPRAFVYPESISALETVRAAGLKTCLVSNTPWGSPPFLWREEMERLGLSPHFDAQVYCGDVGWRKPDGRIFAEATAKLGAQSGECAMVGDHIEWDIEGATAAGMTAVRAGGDSGISALAAARTILKR